MREGIVFGLHGMEADPEKNEITLYIKSNKALLQIDGLLFESAGRNVFINEKYGIAATMTSEGKYLLHSNMLYSQLTGPSKAINEGRMLVEGHMPIEYPIEMPCPKEISQMFLEARMIGAEAAFAEPEVGLPEENLSVSRR